MMDRLTRLLDVSTSTGQFVALLVLYLITITLRCFGHHWVENDHTLIIGALLVLLKNPAHPTNVAPNAAVQVNNATEAQDPPKA